MKPEVRHRREGEKKWIESILEGRWSGSTIVTLGRAIDAGNLPALVAEVEGEPVGLLTWRLDSVIGEDGMERDICRIITLDSLREEEGIASALIDELVRECRGRSIERIRGVTTNDNRPAQFFYQHRQFRLVAIHAGSVIEAREIKPSIPLLGHGAVPIRDELEYELLIADYDPDR